MKLSPLLALSAALAYCLFAEAAPPATSDTGVVQSAATNTASRGTAGKPAMDKAAPEKADASLPATKSGAAATQLDATQTQPAATAADRPGPTAAPHQDPAQLRVNVHAMRVAIEQDDAAEQMAMRMAGPVLTTPLQDSGGIETLRSQLNESLAHLDNRCIGVDARNNGGGNLILVCGDNNGQAQSSVQSSVANTNIIVPSQLPNQPSTGAASSASTPISGASP